MRFFAASAEPRSLSQRNRISAHLQQTVYWSKDGYQEVALDFVLVCLESFLRLSQICVEILAKHLSAICKRRLTFHFLAAQT